MLSAGAGIVVRPKRAARLYGHVLDRKEVNRGSCSLTGGHEECVWTIATLREIVSTPQDPNDDPRLVMLEERYPCSPTSSLGLPCRFKLLLGTAKQFLAQTVCCKQQIAAALYRDLTLIAPTSAT